MSAAVDLDDHFKTALARDIAHMVLGDGDGHGTHRAIFNHATRDDVVVKIENNARSFNNIMEWEVWQSVKDTPHERWFAPCLEISRSGLVLLMQRCEPLPVNKLPTHVPAYFTDLKAENWGLLGRRAVCLDYGLHFMLEMGLTKRMKRCKWTGDD